MLCSRCGIAALTLPSLSLVERNVYVKQSQSDARELRKAPSMHDTAESTVAAVPTRSAPVATHTAGHPVQVPVTGCDGEQIATILESRHAADAHEKVARLALLAARMLAA